MFQGLLAGIVVDARIHSDYSKGKTAKCFVLKINNNNNNNGNNNNIINNNSNNNNNNSNNNNNNNNSDFDVKFLY